MKHLKRITTPVCTSTDNDNTPTTCVVALNKSGMFTLDSFSLIQFIKGARLWLDDQWGVKDAKTVEIHTVMLMSTLHENLIPMQIADRKYMTCELRLDRSDVQLLKEFLELRMKHCEIERDNEDKEFNPDTYISMKLLLIELGTWLMGDIISEEKSLEDYVQHLAEAQEGVDSN